MSEPKFTKKPWKCVKKQDYVNYGVTEHYYDVYQIMDANNKIIATLEEKDKYSNSRNNANLMIVSPEMYEMLDNELQFL